MITIIFGKPRAGKTALMTHFLCEAMFDRERWLKTKSAIEKLNAGGFCLTVPSVPVVASNYDVTAFKFRCRPRLSRRINPFRLGYQDSTCKLIGGTHFLEPYSVIGITEGQKYFNSRESRNFPDWQSRWYEQHGHNDYNIFIDAQRPDLIDLNIRELSQFIEIVEKKNITEEGRTVGIKWLVRRIDGNSELARYLSSGKRDKSCYEEETISIDYNVHNCYNHQMCRPKFYQGHLNEDYDTCEHEPLMETRGGFADYLSELDDELPRGFYKSDKINKT
ncbi:MAG: hypothetical protein FWD49_07920 [Firmicutes bacterium]|nr:hypothetical protein [Bacillota bacterium]